MRGQDKQQGGIFSYRTAEERIAADHPLRAMRQMVDEALKGLSRRFARMYSKHGRPSIAPEKLLRALLLQALYTIRSERQLMEQLDYNILYRWFVGLDMDEAVWDVTVFTKNRERLLKSEVADGFFEQVLQQARARQLLSADHFTVDGTLIEAWAGHKSFQRKDGQGKPPDEGNNAGSSNPSVNFHGQERRNDTHRSTTDPEARLFKKSRGSESKLSFMAHVLMENRNGLVVDTRLTKSTGKAERESAWVMAWRVRRRNRRITLGGDKNYDTQQMAASLRAIGVTPHVAQNEYQHRSSAIDARTTRHPGYAVSQRKRKRVEEIFGWIKTVAGLRKTKHRGRKRVGWIFTFAAAAYNLVRMRNLRLVTA
jgi:transposase